MWFVTSLQIQDSNNADVLLDSGPNLFDIIVSKSVLLIILWSVVEVRKLYLLKWTFALDFNKGGCVKQIWVD